MIRNLCKESCAAPGTGTTVTLSGAQPGFASFAAAFGSNQTVYYFLTDGSQTEAQAGTLAIGSPNTLSRGAPLWTSTGGSTRLNFAGGVTAYCALPADRAPYFDNAGNFPLGGRKATGVAAATAMTDAPQLRQVGWVDLSRQVIPSAVSGVHLTLPAGYDRYRVEYSELGAAVGGGFFWSRFSFDGSTFVTTADYNYVVEHASGTAGTVGPLDTGQINLTGATAAGSSCFGWIEFQCWGTHNWISHTHSVNTAPQHTHTRTAGRLDVNTGQQPLLFVIANSAGNLAAGGRVKLLGSAS